MSAIPDFSIVPSTPSRWERFLRERFRERLASLRGGCVRVSDPFGAFELGDADARQKPIDIHVRDAAFYGRLAAGGSIGAAEAFVDGLWDTDDLVGVVRLLVRNRDVLDGLEKGTARIVGALLRVVHAFRRNSRSGARRNIAAHYDLGNAFFELFLGEDLMYSSALFSGDDDSLETASRRKLDTICRKLELKPSDRVIEIGTGWGGFALHAARHYGCHVTTTTISQEQYAAAAERVAAAGLEDRITLLCRDYRDIVGTYDKLVSIEMIEAVGADYLDAWFAKLETLLVPDGRALVQAITIEDHRYAQAVRSVDFIKRHVFPGSFIPSLAAMLASKTRSTRLALTHAEDFGGSYARTLAAWRARFHAARAKARELGYDERFLRLWDFYLAYCEGGFRERAIGVAQLVFDKPGCAPARDRAVGIAA